MTDIIRKLLFLFPASDKWKFGGLLGLMLIGAFLEVLGIGMLPVFISIVASPERILEMEKLAPLLDFFEIEDGGRLLVVGGIGLVVTFLVKNTYIVAFHYIQARFLMNRYRMLSARLFDKYMNAPYAGMLSKNTSEVLRNVTHETGYVIQQVVTPMLKLGMDTILILGTLILLFLVSPIITLAAILLFAVAGGGFLKLIREKGQTYGRRAQLERMVMIQAVNEGVGGLKDIRVLQRADWFLARFKKSLAHYANALVFRTTTRHSTKPILETVAVSGMLMIALVLYWQEAPLGTIVPLLTLFGAAAVRLLPAMREIVEAINGIRFYGYSIHPIHDELKRLEHIPEPLPVPSGKESGTLRFQREIRFENVSYFYPGCSQPAVRDVSLQIAKGEAVGFIGASGAGKTTVIDLLLGILEPQKGKITVDGVDIRGAHKEWLPNVGYIPQFIFLTDDTLRRNIALGLPDKDIDNARLTVAIEAAQLAETVKMLPDGIDTVVGERGVRLSGGQRQRIGIARALYGNPSVLIMDEATSALDSETERYVIESMERLKGKRTIVMIAHRLSTVQKCDRLFIIDQGQVADSGRHEELFKRNSELWQEPLVPANR